MSDEFTWARTLAAAIASQIDKVDPWVDVKSVRIDSAVEISITYSIKPDEKLLGLAIRKTDVEHGPERLASATAEELAATVIWVGLCEPRHLDVFLPADLNGIHWLPAAAWMGLP